MKQTTKKKILGRSWQRIIMRNKRARKTRKGGNANLCAKTRYPGKFHSPYWRRQHKNRDTVSRRCGDTKFRAGACAEFAVEVKEYRSINAFLNENRESAGQDEWRQSHGQMWRDMRTISGKEWARKRGVGGSGLGGGQKGKHKWTALVVSEHAELLLEPNQKPIKLAPIFEHQILKSFRI